DVLEVVTEPADLTAVRTALDEAGVEVEEQQLAWIPTWRVPVDEATAPKLLRLVDALEENDDVDEVNANFDIEAAVLERVAGEWRPRRDRWGPASDGAPPGALVRPAVLGAGPLGRRRPDPARRARLRRPGPRLGHRSRPRPGGGRHPVRPVRDRRRGRGRPRRAPPRHGR